MGCKINFSLFSLLLLLLLSGCRKSLYNFAPSSAYTGPAHGFSGTSESNPAALGPVCEIPEQMVGFKLQKVDSRVPDLRSRAQGNPDKKTPVMARLLPAKISRPAVTRAPVHKALSQEKKQKSHFVKKAFPVVWFIILSALLVGLFILYKVLTSGKSYGMEIIVFILLIPVGIPWLLILAKALAPGYGFFLFLAMVLAIILLTLFIYWLTEVQEKARREKHLREHKKKQLEREQAP